MHKSPPQDSHNIPIDWSSIKTVLLDMDGTLLDKYFDDFFWEHHVPAVFAKVNNLANEECRKTLLARYKSVENSLQWTDLHFWTRQLGLDIPQLKHDINHLIGILDHAKPFLQFVKNAGIHLCLVTNAHPISLKLKLDKTQIAPFFDQIICSDDVGEAKENISFWEKLEKHINFDKNTTFFADDTEKVLQTADTYGIRHLVHIARSSTKKEPCYSSHFTSIRDFREIYAHSLSN